MEIAVDSLRGEAIARFLAEHLAEMRSVSPPESSHALGLAGLRHSSVTFWTVFDEGKILGCGALKMLDAQHGEIKSMRTDRCARGQGVGSKLLLHIFTVAHARGLRKLLLETGSMDFFEPARQLYLRHGFDYCEPFGNYREDPNSVFMEKVLR